MNFHVHVRYIIKIPKSYECGLKIPRSDHENKYFFESVFTFQHNQRTRHQWTSTLNCVLFKFFILFYYHHYQKNYVLLL